MLGGRRLVSTVIHRAKFMIHCTAVIINSLRKFTRFIWWLLNCANRLPTFRPRQQTWLWVCLHVRCRRLHPKKSTTALSAMPHRVSEMNFVKNFANLSMMSSCLYHLILLLSVHHHLHHHHFHYASLQLSSTPDSKLTVSIYPSHRSLPHLFRANLRSHGILTAISGLNCSSVFLFCFSLFIVLVWFFDGLSWFNQFLNCTLHLCTFLSFPLHPPSLFSITKPKRSSVYRNYRSLSTSPNSCQWVSLVVRVSSTSAADSNWSSAYWRHIGVSCYCRSRPRSVLGCWRLNDCTHHSNCQNLFCSAPPDT